MWIGYPSIILASVLISLFPCGMPKGNENTGGTRGQGFPVTFNERGS